MHDHSREAAAASAEGAPAALERRRAEAEAERVSDTVSHNNSGERSVSTLHDEDRTTAGRHPDDPVVLRVFNDPDVYDECFEGGALPPSHPFAWARVVAAPKADHGTFSTRWFQTRTYHLLHTGGFLRLATERGRVYWLAQNEVSHRTPDWKLHFSIAPRQSLSASTLDAVARSRQVTGRPSTSDEACDGQRVYDSSGSSGGKNTAVSTANSGGGGGGDFGHGDGDGDGGDNDNHDGDGDGDDVISAGATEEHTAWERDIGTAWDIVAALFMERCCEVGMKVRYAPWTNPGQRGREVTVYVYAHNRLYDEGHRGGPMAGLSPEGQEHLHHLGFEHEALFDDAFWTSFIAEAEARLGRAGLVPSGVADGDLPLPGCRFASLRNEAFVPVPNPAWREGDNPRLRTQLAYPPNELGWNAASHDNPLAGTYHALAGRLGLRTV